MASFLALIAANCRICLVLFNTKLTFRFQALSDSHLYDPRRYNSDKMGRAIFPYIYATTTITALPTYFLFYENISISQRRIMIFLKKKIFSQKNRAFFNKRTSIRSRKVVQDHVKNVTFSKKAYLVGETAHGAIFSLRLYIIR